MSLTCMCLLKAKEYDLMIPKYFHNYNISEISSTTSFVVMEDFQWFVYKTVKNGGDIERLKHVYLYSTYIPVLLTARKKLLETFKEEEFLSGDLQIRSLSVLIESGNVDKVVEMLGLFPEAICHDVIPYYLCDDKYNYMIEPIKKVLEAQGMIVYEGLTPLEYFNEYVIE